MDDLEWLEPWAVVKDPQDAIAWSHELKRECPPGHMLFDREITFLGRRLDRDDFLVSLDAGKVAVVHLTWRRETDPLWPATKVFASLGQWREEVMAPDHAEWAG